MRLDITRGIQRKGFEVPFDLAEAWGEDRWNGDAISFERPVTFSGTYMLAGETVVLRGVARATVRSRCARCLAPALTDVSAAVEEAFTRDEERASDPADDQYRYSGHVLELTDAVRTALLLELPSRILCKEDCKGLCPVCGQDLNVKTCSCRREFEGRKPFSALASLLDEDEEV